MRVTEGRNQRESGSKQLHVGFLRGLLFDAEYVDIVRPFETLEEFYRAVRRYVSSTLYYGSEI
jgi:hypothetical protein